MANFDAENIEQLNSQLEICAKKTPKKFRIATAFSAKHIDNILALFPHNGELEIAIKDPVSIEEKLLELLKKNDLRSLKFSRKVLLTSDTGLKMLHVLVDLETKGKEYPNLVLPPFTWNRLLSVDYASSDSLKGLCNTLNLKCPGNSNMTDYAVFLLVNDHRKILQNEARKPIPSHILRIALVIGCSNYSSFRQLPNSVNDAQKMKDTLELLGFTVIHKPNVKNKSEMKQVNN